MEPFSCLMALALGWFGEDAKAAVPALRAALGDEMPYVRRAAAAALARIAPPG